MRAGEGVVAELALLGIGVARDASDAITKTDAATAAGLAFGTRPIGLGTKPN